MFKIHYLKKLYKCININVNLNEYILCHSILEVKIIPRSSKNEILFDGINKIKIKVTEIPRNNKANQAIIDILHKYLHISKNKIIILSGLKSSNKKIQIKN